MKKLISFAVCLMLAFTLCLTACTPGGGKVADNTERLSAITKKCKLTKSYTGKSFLADGIGEATVAYYTDGDTLTVNLLTEGNSAAIRFHSIDTPESTGGVEKWGLAASNFVKEQLSKATQIVIEATAVPAEKDSYGTRYLGYVWYKTAEHDFWNLNLELVENGFSPNKGVDTPKYPYNSYFKEAEKAARQIKLRIFSDKADPLYSDKPEEISLKDILETLKTNPGLLYNEETNMGSKVKFYAAVTSVKTSGTTTYTAIDYDKETGEFYEMQLYTGYEAPLPLGHYYRVIGVLQKHNGNWQISGIEYNEIYGGKPNNANTHTHPIQYDYYLTFDSSVSFISPYSDTLYTDATVTEVVEENGTMTVTATATKRNNEGLDGEPVTFTFSVEVPENVTKLAVGSVFSVQGYQFEEGSKHITILKYSDITIK